MGTKAVLFLMMCAACGSKGAPQQQATGSGSAGSGSGAAVAKDPWVAKDASAVPETPEQRKARADQALSRVADIMPKLAKVRELSFEHDIPREYQTTEDFRKFVHAEIAKEMPKDKSDDESAALFHIGLLTKPGNVAELEEQAFVTQAGAYYDPATKKFFLVMVPDNDTMLDTISAHELTHGLQDQHFNLQKYMPEEDKSLDDDHAAARRFVAEGDATFTMFLYAMAGSGQPAPQAVKFLKSQLDMQAAMSPEEMLKQNAFGASLDPEIKKSVDAMADIPMTVLIPMVDSYIQGAELVATAFERGGWKAVNELFTTPPESTEQTLHPATKLYPNRDHPKVVTVTGTDKKSEAANLVMGELQWQVYFGLWLPEKKTEASEGWGGDRVIVTKKADGKMTARISTVWDTAKDADEFAAAYTASLAKRLPKGSGDPTSAAGFDRGDGNGKIFVEKKGPAVKILDGADTASFAF